MAGIRAKNIELGSGVAATRATLAVMGNVALSASQDPNVRAVAMQLIAGLPSRAYLSEAQAISNFVRDKVRYTRDPADMELLQDPAFILGAGSDDNPAPMQGDCDDKVTLLAALLLSVGFEGVHFLAVGDDPDVFTHVLLEVNVNGTWYPAETCPDPTVGSVPFGSEAREFPYNIIFDVVTGKALNGLASLGATSAPTRLPPRGTSPYVNFTNIPALEPDTPNVSLAEWAAFFKNVSGEAAARVAEGQATYDTLNDAIDAMLTGASLWAGFNTTPPIPLADMYAPNGEFGGNLKTISASGTTTVKAAPPVAMPGGGSGSGGQGGVRKQLLGLGAAASTVQVFPVPNPPSGYSGQGKDVGSGYFVLYGNTNGNYAPADMTDWLAYAVTSNGKIPASSAWATGSAIQTWDAGFEPQQRTATQIADIAAVVLSAVGIGEAAAAIDGTAVGAGAGTSTLAPTVVSAAAPTDAIAAPVAEVDTGLTASTIAPLTDADIGTLASTGAAADAAAAGSTAADIADGAKAVGAVVGAGAVIATVHKAATSTPTTAATAPTTAAAAGGGAATFFSKYKVPLLIGGGLALAYLVAG